jgi:hypothetical protein
MDTAHDFPVFPEHQDGPITVTIEYSIANGDRERFRTLMEEVQAACRRNGAFQCRLDERLDQPGLFRLDYMGIHVGGISSPEKANDRRRGQSL